MIRRLLRRLLGPGLVALAVLGPASVAHATGTANIQVAQAGKAAGSAVAGQGSHAGHNHGAAEIADVDPAALHKPGDLPDLVIGRSNAPITIVEYASITCSHCGRFHQMLLPEVKKKYIDTGIARLVIREFPLESVAAAAAMLVRCAKPPAQLPFLEALFARQQQWLAQRDVRDALVAIAGEFGIDATGFDACLSDDALLNKIAASRSRANEQFGVKSTPTFFVNGKGLIGPQTIAEFDAIIGPMRQAK